MYLANPWNGQCGQIYKSVSRKLTFIVVSLKIRILAVRPADFCISPVLRSLPPHVQERHLASAIDRSFGSFAEMQFAFSNAASVFSGSG